LSPAAVAWFQVTPRSSDTKISLNPAIAYALVAIYYLVTLTEFTIGAVLFPFSTGGFDAHLVHPDLPFGKVLF
jgi:hypothetical protein